MLVLIFGGSTNSLTATISAFLAGLALGSFIAGKFVDNLKTNRLLKIYGLLELGVGLSALITPFFFYVIKLVFRLLSDGSTPTPALLFVKFFLTSLVILIPTTLMGATLPFLVKFIQKQNRTPDNILGILYSINTFGGVAGVLLAGFVLIELFGLQMTLVVAAGINILVAILAQRIANEKR